MVNVRQGIEMFGVKIPLRIFCKVLKIPAPSVKGLNKQEFGESYKHLITDQSVFLSEVSREVEIDKANSKRTTDRKRKENAMSLKLLRESVGLRPNKKSIRQCLSCDKDFVSHGPHNRICPDCTENHKDVLGL